MTTTVRAAAIDLLRRLAMTTVFGNPGSTELPLFRDFPSDFRYVLGLQESVVLAMADGHAQATGTAALVNLHSAAGTGHALGNLFTAYRNRTPLVVTAGQQARAILLNEPFLFAERATEFPRPYVKWAIEPARAADVPAALLRAWLVAMTPPCGPTFVSVPVDDWDRPCGGVPPVPRLAPPGPGDPATLSEVADLLAKAARPVFVVGSGVARDHAWDVVVALAERHEASVWIAPMTARAAFPEDHRCFAGFLPAMREAIVDRLADADLLLIIGAPVFTWHVEGSGPPLPQGVRVVQMTVDPEEAVRLPEGCAIVGALRAGLEILLAGPAPRARHRTVHRPKPATLPAHRLTDVVLMQRLAVLRPADSIIVEEAPSSRGAMHDHLSIVIADGFHTCASGGLGHALPAAIGVALARPGRRVIALLGDGSAMYAIQGLFSAARLAVNVSFVIVNNAGYQALVGFGSHFGLDSVPGCDLGGIDFVALATAQGVPAAKVTTCDTLDAALLESFATPGPSLVDVVVS